MPQELPAEQQGPDIYLLAMSWAPQHCCTKPHQCVAAPWAHAANHLTLHGLWPAHAQSAAAQADQRQLQQQTTHCKTAHAAELLPSQLPRDAVDLAPAYTTWNATEHRAEMSGLAHHEWRKHGSCSGLTPAAYFAEALRGMLACGGDRGTPPLLSRSVGGAIATDELRGNYPRRVAVRADRSCRLAEVTTCWQRRSDGRLGAMIDCPASVMQSRDRTKRCQSLHVAALGMCLATDKKERPEHGPS